MEFGEISILLIGDGADLSLWEKLDVDATVEGVLSEGLSRPEICEPKKWINVKGLT